MKKSYFLAIIMFLTLESTLIAQSFYAVQFGASADYINTSFVPNFGNSQDFSIEFRLKTAAWTSDPSLISDKNWANGSNDGWNIALGNNGTGIDVNVGDGSARADLLAGTVNDNQWHHILVTFDRNGSLSLYIDGILLQSVSMSNVGNINSGNTVKIAQDGTANYNSAATCQMADIRIWNKVLPLSESAAWRCRYLDASHPSYADLIHYWKLDEGTGTTVADSKGTSNGTLIGSAFWVNGNLQTIGCSQTEIGAGYMVDFDGVNDWLDCSGNGGNKVSASSIGLPSAQLTVETWVKPNRFRTWDAMLAFIQDNQTFERGWDLEVRDNNKFGFSLTTGTTLTYLETSNSFNENEWYHVAGVFDGASMKIYVNGILENTSNAQAGNINYADSWLSIGMYKDDNETNAFDGSLDEVRIWSVARSESEIRSTMCRKLIGNETGLYAYWRLDESVASIAYDASNNNHNGVLTNMNLANAHQISEAPIGDTSVFLYPGNWQSQNLLLSSANQGSLNIENVSLNPQGVHIYMVRDTPNFSNGIWNRGNTNNYFGVFSTNPSNFNVLYDYTSYSDAMSNESFLNLYQRPHNAASTWVVDPSANLSTTLNNIRIDSVSGRREFIIADFIANNCLNATNLNVDSIFDTRAVLSWDGFGTSYNIEWGPAGFSLGNGNLISNVSTTTLSISGLSARTDYEFYVQVTCAANNQSTWVGPFGFSTVDPCSEPSSIQVLSTTCNSAIISWSSTNVDWVIEWAPSTLFQPNLGILTNANSNPFTLTGLINNTDYTFRIKTDCDSLISNWSGTFTFRTDSACVSTNVDLNNNQPNIRLFPNPVQDYLHIESSSIEIMQVRLYNQLGQLIDVFPVVNRNRGINLGHVESGFYHLIVQSNEGYQSYKIFIE